MQCFLPDACATQHADVSRITVKKRKKIYFISVLTVLLLSIFFFRISNGLKFLAEQKFTLKSMHDSQTLLTDVLFLFVTQKLGPSEEGE